MPNQEKIQQALEILIMLGMPLQQQNERTARCLLALLNLYDETPWFEATNPMLGIRGILDFIRERLEFPYAENTRETIRDESIKPLIAAGVLIYNPDKPNRAPNSPETKYQISDDALSLFKQYGSESWEDSLNKFQVDRVTLIDLYARLREFQKVSIALDDGKEVQISPGDHSELIRQILDDFRPRFAPNSKILYIGDTGQKWGYFIESLLSDLGVSLNKHGQMPDVVLYMPDKNWLFLNESVTSNGPIDGRRYEELMSIFGNSKAGLVFVTAFPKRATMRAYLSVLAWETEVWIADSPDHLIHFDGEKFFGPYTKM